MTEIVSHRGGAMLWPENSRIAFENTARLPVDQVEFDVHPSRDGELVVIHDATLERTTDGSGPVSGLDWDALSRLALAHTGGQRMLRLEEVIGIFQPTAISLRVEVKADHHERRYPGLEKKVLETLRRTGMADRSIVTSFHAETVEEVAVQGRPKGLIWVLAPVVQNRLGLARCLEIARSLGATGVGIRESCLEPDDVAAVREAGLSPGCWAVNTRSAIERALSLGIDLFTTDRPDLALSLRDRLGDA